MLVTTQKWFAGLALICSSVLLGGCGATEDPAESLIKWKIEGRYDLRYMTDQGVTYGISSPDKENFVLKKISAQGEVEWENELNLINTYNEVGLATLYLQSGEDGTNRIVVYTSDYKPSGDIASSTWDYHILVLDENGEITNEIQTEGQTFPDGNYDSYSIDTKIPGLIIRYNSQELDLISENSTTSTAIPENLSGYIIRSVRHTIGGVIVYFSHESDDALADKLAYISLSGEIHWIEDAPEFVTSNSILQESMYFKRNNTDGICEYTLQPFDESGFLTPSTFSCSEQELSIFSQTDIVGDDIHFSTAYKGLNYIRRDLNTGEIKASYENPIDTSGAYVSSLSSYTSYHVSDTGQVALPYLVTTDRGGVDVVLNAGIHRSYRSGVVVLNSDASLYAEIEFPEYHIYTWLLRCYSWCSDNGDLRSGYDIQGTKVINGEIYVSLRYKDYDNISGTYTYYYYLAALN